MSNSSTKTREARNNPAVREKLESLAPQWETLSKAERSKYIDELTALGCPAVDIGNAVGLKEAAVRYYKSVEKAATKASVAEEPYYGNAIEKLLHLDDETKPKTPAPPVVLSRPEQVKKAVIAFMGNETVGSALMTLESAKRQCYEWQAYHNLPPALGPEISPKDAFAKYNPNGLELFPGKKIEFLAITLCRLLPQSYERDQLFCDMETAYRSGSLRG